VPRGLILLLLTAAALLSCGGEAAAHAVLVKTGPFDGAVIAGAPQDVMLRFNEPVAPVFVHLIGTAGPVEVRERPRVEGAEIRLRLPAALADGGYLVSWRVVSTDSHPIAGSFAFSIGDAVPPPAVRTGAAEALRDRAWRIAKVAVRLIQDIGLLIAAGGTMFRIFVLRGGPDVPRFRGVLASAGIVAVAAAVASIGVEGAVIRPGPLNILFFIDTWRYGWATTVGTSSVVLIAGMALLAAGHVVRDRTIAIVGAIGAIESLALTGHSAASSWAVQVALMIHVTAAAYWLGSLWPLRLVLRTARAVEAERIVRRFSAIAVPAVAALAATAFIVAASRIENIAIIIQTSYGQLLMAKVLLVLALLALAAFNRQRLTPSLAREPERARERLRRTIAVEIGLGAAVLIVAGIVAHTPPPAAELHSRHAERRSAVAISEPKRDELVVVANEKRGYVAKIVLSPARAGSNGVAVELWGPDGRQPVPLEVAMEVSRPEAKVEPLVRVLTADGNKRYVADGFALPLAGRWSVRLDVLVTDFDKAVFDAEVLVR
jgi:copper transport protein